MTVEVPDSITPEQFQSGIYENEDLAEEIKAKLRRFNLEEIETTFRVESAQAESREHLALTREDYAELLEEIFSA